MSPATCILLMLDVMRLLVAGCHRLWVGVRLLDADAYGVAPTSDDECLEVR